MGINASGINIAKIIIKDFEGLRLKPYICAGGKRTIGYGHVIRKGERYGPISANTADKLLEDDIAKTKAAVQRCTQVPLTQEQEAALISFTFNCGAGAFQASILRQKLNRGEYELAANEFLRWVHVGGVRLVGLVRRRTAERELFLAGI